MTSSRLRAPAALVVLVACGGAEPSSLFDSGALAQGDASQTPDAIADNEAGSPEDAGNLNDGGVTTKDAAPKDAGNPYQDPGIACGNTECDASAALCCGSITSYYPQYTYAFACEPLTDLVQCAAGVPVYCDDDHDCPNSGVCCGDLDFQGHYAKVTCKTTCTGNVLGYTQVHFCDPKAPDCSTNQKCVASTSLSGYFVCQ